MVPSMLIKEPGSKLRSKLTEEIAKVQKNACAPYYMATPEMQIDNSMHPKLNEMTNIFLSRESSGGYFNGDELQLR